MSEMTTRRHHAGVGADPALLLDGGLRNASINFSRMGSINYIECRRTETFQRSGQPISDDIMRLAVEQYARER